MAQVREYLGYNRFGLRYVSAKEVQEAKKRVLSRNFSVNQKSEKICASKKVLPQPNVFERN